MYEVGNSYTLGAKDLNPKIMKNIIHKTGLFVFQIKKNYQNISSMLFLWKNSMV